MEGQKHLTLSSRPSVPGIIGFEVVRSGIIYHRVLSSRATDGKSKGMTRVGPLHAVVGTRICDFLSVAAAVGAGVELARHGARVIFHLVEHIAHRERPKRSTAAVRVLPCGSISHQSVLPERAHPIVSRKALHHQLSVAVPRMRQACESPPYNEDKCIYVSKAPIRHQSHGLVCTSFAEVTELSFLRSDCMNLLV